MFRIIKVLVSLCSLVGFVWFGMTVNLGDRTLFQHVRAIAESKESSELVDGTKTKVTSLFGGAEKSEAAAKAEAAEKKPPVVVKERSSENTGAKLASHAEPQDGVTPADRQGMRKIIASRRPTDRAAGPKVK